MCRCGSARRLRSRSSTLRSVMVGREARRFNDMEFRRRTGTVWTSEAASVRNVEVEVAEEEL